MQHVDSDRKSQDYIRPKHRDGDHFKGAKGCTAPARIGASGRIEEKNWRHNSSNPGNGNEQLTKREKKL